ncbi:Tm-1-like ATP-binding domain-containing protein [Phaeobacter sp.]|uniref:Tm-1-like ATP-binding domain-containing protein n=1 Tax=Phaeobacter sp. TaxID=1902409 RepID=UPI0025ED3C95|nr:Tm-1-like ATP-binding domain-containing protein [Phaeobacter sp.]
MVEKTILIVGTYDTKEAELTYLAEVITGQGGLVKTMDVSVLGDPNQPTDISKHDVAEAVGSSIDAAIASGDENTAMQIMGAGAATLALAQYRAGSIHGVIVLGGTMGTDLALDLCSALPIGVPKYVVSTVAFSALLPPDRLPADVQMILWAGGLYGLNGICKASLSQAAGAVLGAARAVEPPTSTRPVIGMTSFGKTVLRYMVDLKPALESRGFDVAVFHATGMGGRAFESLATEGAFAAVMDFAPQEVSNHLFGGLSAGATRMTGAGRSATPQMIAPGCHDLVDFVGWQAVPDKLRDRPVHAHNRLLSSAVLSDSERRQVADALCDKLSTARGPVAVLVPQGGCHEWDREGADLHDSAALAAFCDHLMANCPANASLHPLDGHINDQMFIEKVLEIFDGWLADGTVSRG